MRNRYFLLLLTLFGLLQLPGCAPEDAPAQAAPTHETVAEFVLRASPARGTVDVFRVVPLEHAGANTTMLPQGPGLAPLALVDVNLCADGVDGSNDPTACGLPAGTPTVELVTDPNSIQTNAGCPIGYQTNSFCANVTLNSFWSVPLNFTYAQITAITDTNGVPLAGHNGWNVDGPGSTGLDASLGLWQYQTGSIDTTHASNGTTGIMLPGASNGAMKTWVFHNPDGADFYAKITVWGSTAYSNYSLGTSFHTALDACTSTSGTAVTLSASGLPITQPAPTNSAASFGMPFDFTFYGTRYTAGASMTVTRSGNIGLGSVAATNAGNVALPSTGAPHPGVFPFWDTLAWAKTGSRGLCARVYGTAPNRQLAITWKRVGFTSTDTAFMTFTTVFNESTEEVWFQYPTMAGNSPTGGATVGAQDGAGTTAASGSTSAQATFASGTGKVLLPLP